MSVRFGASDAVEYAWLRFKEQPGALIAVLLAVFGIVLIPWIVYIVLLATDHAMAGILVYLLAIVVQLVLGVGTIAISLKVADRKPWAFGELFSQGGRMLPYIGASILYGIVVVIGYFIFLLPGMYLSIRLSLYQYFVVDKGQGPIESLKSSWALTEGSFWDLVGVQCVITCVVMLSLIPLGLGLLITIPMSSVLMAYVYRRLQQHPYVPAT